MVWSDVEGEPPASTGPEELSFGPAVSGPRSWRKLVVALGVVVVLVTAGALWWLWPVRPVDFSQHDLSGAYAGMVRADGTNDVSAVARDQLTEPPSPVEPAACAPLFDITMSNQFPTAAVDGVSTYWLDEGSATIALTTYRFADSAAARRQLDEVASALTSCAGKRLRVQQRHDITVIRQAVPPPSGTDSYLSFLMSAPAATTRFSTDIAQVTNTVTWQYRYDYHSRADYSPLAAQQLMASLVGQLRSVQRSHQTTGLWPRRR